MTRHTIMVAVLALLAFTWIQCSDEPTDKPARKPPRYKPLPDTPLRDEPEARGTEPRVALKIAYPSGTFQMVADQDTESTVKVTSGGKSRTQDMTQKVTQWLTLEVARPDAKGSRTITVRFTRFRMAMDAGLVSVALDTDNPKSLAKNPTGKLLQAMMKATPVMRRDADGNITSVRGMDRIVKDIVAADPNAAQMAGELKEFLSDETMTAMIAQAQKFMPTGPVGVGAVWYGQAAMPVPMIGQLDCRTKCKLTTLEKTSAGRIAALAIRMKAESTGGKTVQMGAAAMNVDSATMRTAGTMELDVETGLMRKTVNRVTGRFALSLRSARRQTTEMDITMNGEQTITVTPAK